jgi:hypothetical protein
LNLLAWLGLLYLYLPTRWDSLPRLFGITTDPLSRYVLRAYFVAPGVTVTPPV